MTTYLDPLFTALDVLVPNEFKAGTPLFAIATGGMRGRRNLANGDVNLQESYDALSNAINEYIMAKAVGPNSFDTAHSRSPRGTMKRRMAGSRLTTPWLVWKV